MSIVTQVCSPTLPLCLGRCRFWNPTLALTRPPIRKPLIWCLSRRRRRRRRLSLLVIIEGDPLNTQRRRRRRRRRLYLLVIIEEEGRQSLFVV